MASIRKVNFLANREEWEDFLINARKRKTDGSKILRKFIHQFNENCRRNKLPEPKQKKLGGKELAGDSSNTKIEVNK